MEKQRERKKKHASQNKVQEAKQIFCLSGLITQTKEEQRILKITESEKNKLYQLGLKITGAKK